MKSVTLFDTLIDTVTISLNSDSLLIPSLESIRTVQSDRGVSISGNYRNLFIKQSNNNTTISGSLQKFSRLFDESYDESKKAILGLCDTFSFEPSEATVKRIDVSKTINTDFEPKLYYQYLGAHQHYFRTPFKNSLYYSNTLRRLNFYDKAKESGIAGNLLRYEQRYFKPQSVFNKHLTLVDLLTEEVYHHFLTRWKNDYSRIQKVKTLIPMESLKSPKQFYDFLIAKQINEMGDDFINQIKIAQRAGYLSRQNAKRIKDKVSRINKSSFFEPNELIIELDKKILTYDR